MLKIKCDMCSEELKEAGGILFGPPVNNLSLKTHLCVSCYEILKKIADTSKNEKDKKKVIEK